MDFNYSNQGNSGGNGAARVELLQTVGYIRGDVSRTLDAMAAVVAAAQAKINAPDARFADLANAINSVMSVAALIAPMQFAAATAIGSTPGVLSVPLSAAGN
jgi:hypothetical protein